MVGFQYNRFLQVSNAKKQPHAIFLNEETAVELTLKHFLHLKLSINETDRSLQLEYLRNIWKIDF